MPLIQGKKSGSGKVDGEGHPGLGGGKYSILGHFGQHHSHEEDESEDKSPNNVNRPHLMPSGAYKKKS